ncbi:hypothetical protein [Actinokineospora fastidiosa]|uniref:Uncharacterized protein n=1 Tax=Actinokineospora fastidiosa TaxID=1816 RepID=A0A918LAT7_9PSEU|nr:hypothetical protein [Actinokineospora fastidiosa]GGS26253.1 hypothetical protein GCM10010171_19620 [Actinokineospora fastidiosa]
MRELGHLVLHREATPGDIVQEREAHAPASEAGLTIPRLARELAWDVPRVREMLGMVDRRPVLELVSGGA